MDYLIGYCIAVIIWGIIWGCVTNAVIHNKGYDDNWFWWGFFFSFIAVIVAFSKPEIVYSNGNDRDDENYSFNSNYGHSSLFHDTTATARQDGMWQCAWCNKMNSNYVGTCSCGKSKSESEEKRKSDAKIAKDFYAGMGTSEHSDPTDDSQKTLNNIEAIKKLKELLDMGAITQEEFEQKKKELL